MTDLVVVSLERWDTVWRRNQHLVTGLLRRDPELRVLFVEPATDPLHDALSHRRPRLGRGLRRAAAMTGVATGRLWLYEPTKLLPRRIDRRADARLARSVVRAGRRAGLSTPLLWVNDAIGANVLEQTDWPAVYDITDDWVRAERTSAETDRLIAQEDVLLRRAREVVVCSRELARSKGSARPVTLIPNAVDVDAYRVPAPRPGDLPAGPVALYVGTVHRDRIDLDLCLETAQALRGLATLVLVGPAPLGPADRRLLVDSGVLLLGARPHERIPGYLQHADVLVVPHVVTPFTESLDPIKLYEYRAVGRPVVSTPVAGFRDSGDPRIRAVAREDFSAEVVRRVPATSTFPEGADDLDVPSWADRTEAFAQVLSRMGV